MLLSNDELTIFRIKNRVGEGAAEPVAKDIKRLTNEEGWSADAEHLKGGDQMNVMLS